MESKILHISEGSFFHNARMKIYPTGLRELMVSSKRIFCEKGFELEGWRDSSRGSASKASGSARESCSNIERSQRRASSKLRDYALCNDFSFFVTLTLNPEKIDRYDHKAIIKPLNQWLDNCVRRHGLKYLLIPEYHKDGAIHFHGFFNNALPVVDSGTFRLEGSKAPRRPRSERQRQQWLADSSIHQVFNIPAWRYGFSTALPLYGSYESAVSYVCKYIRKGAEKIGGRWYLSGGALKLPEVELLDVDFYEMEKADNVYSFEVPEARAKFLIIRENFELTNSGKSIARDNLENISIFPETSIK